MAEATLVTPITPEHFDYDLFAVPERAYPKLPPRAQIEGAIETLIAILDAAEPDADFEEVGAEDSFQEHADGGAAGCPVADPGGNNVEDEGEPDHDAELETWSNPDDHAAELFIGRRK